MSFSRINPNNTIMKLLIFCFILNLSFSISEIEVFKLFGYEENNNLIGSKVASFNLLAVHFSGIL